MEYIRNLMAEHGDIIAGTVVCTLLLTIFVLLIERSLRLRRLKSKQYIERRAELKKILIQNLQDPESSKSKLSFEAAIEVERHNIYSCLPERCPFEVKTTFTEYGREMLVIFEETNKTQVFHFIQGDKQTVMAL